LIALLFTENKKFDHNHCIDYSNAARTLLAKNFTDCKRTTSTISYRTRLKNFSPYSRTDAK